MNTSDSRLHHKITISSWEGYNPSSLFRNNVWKLHGLPKSAVLDRGPQFVAELNKMLGNNIYSSSLIIYKRIGQNGW